MAGYFVLCGKNCYKRYIETLTTEEFRKHLQTSRTPFKRGIIGTAKEMTLWPYAYWWYENEIEKRKDKEVK